MPRRVAFANDPLELLAVLKQTNTDKDGADAASWLPPRPELRCAFVARQVAVKARYRLRMTQREHDAIAAVLAACPAQPLAEGPAPGQPHSGWRLVSRSDAPSAMLEVLDVNR